MCNVDICFVLDCSSSMSSNIDKIQPQIAKLAKQLRVELLQKRKESSVRFACVFFRDYDAKKNRVEGLDFTESLQTFHERITHIETVGGSDMPEDVLGGLNMAVNFSWKGSRNILVFVGDAPCHGSKYHSLDDTYPDGDPSGLTPEDVLGRMKEKRIHFLFVKLASDTNRMVEMFRPMYEDKALQLEIKVLDSRSEKSLVREKLMNAITPLLRQPYSLMYWCAQVVKQQSNWREYLHLLPEEVTEYVEDIPLDTKIFTAWGKDKSGASITLHSSSASSSSSSAAASLCGDYLKDSAAAVSGAIAARMLSATADISSTTPLSSTPTTSVEVSL